MDKYDFILIAPIDTLIGQDIFQLAQQSPLNTQCLAITGRWNARLESSPLYHVHYNEETEIFELAEIANKQEITQTTVLIADVVSHASQLIFERQGNKVIDLGKRAQALEQTAQFLAMELNEQQRADLIYTRDYISGLSCAGVPFKALQSNNTVSYLTITERERRIEGQQTLWDKLSTQPTCLFEPKTELKEARLFLVHCDNVQKIDNQYLNYLNQLEANNKYQTAEQNHATTELNNKLIIYTSQAENSSELNLEKITKIELFTQGVEEESLVALHQHLQENPNVVSCCYTGKYSNYFSAEFQQVNCQNLNPIVNHIVDQLLGCVLKFDRPLRHYGCTFFFPFRLKGNPNLNSNNIPSFEYAGLKGQCCGHQNVDRFNFNANELDSLYYLYPVVRQQIFPSNSLPNPENRSISCMKEYRYEPIKRALNKNLSSKLGPSTKYQYEPINSTKQTKPNTDLTKLELHQHYQNINKRLWGWKDKKDQYWAEVQSAKLYQFDQQLYILEVHVFKDFFDCHPSKTNTSFVRNDNSWWHDYFTSNELSESIQDASVGRWLTYTSKMREVTSLFELREEDKKRTIHYQIVKQCPEDKRLREECNYEIKDHDRTTPPRFAKYWIDKIGLELGDDLKMEPISDNRMFVNASYAFCGAPNNNPTAQKNYEALFSIAAYVDPQTSAFIQGYAYDPDFTKQLLAKHRYDRWKALGNQYAFTDYSNVYMGAGDVYHNKIGSCHVFNNYQKTLLLNLYYREKLHYFNHEISRATQSLTNEKNRTDYQKLKQEFIHFSNSYWFQEVTAQIQGKEIFNKQFSALDIEKEYKFIEHEIEVADNYIQADIASKFSRIGAYVAGFTIFMEAFKTFILSHKYNNPAEYSFSVYSFFSLIPIMTLVVIYKLIRNGTITDIVNRSESIKQLNKCVAWILAIFVITWLAWWSVNYTGISILDLIITS